MDGYMEYAGTPWLTIDEAARYLRVSVGTLRNWISAKRLPHVKRGRLVRLNRGELDEWLREYSTAGCGNKAKRAEKSRDSEHGTQTRQGSDDRETGTSDNTTRKENIDD